MTEHLINFEEAFSAMSSFLEGKSATVKNERGGYSIQAEEKFFIPMTPGLWREPNKISKYVTELREKSELTSLIYGKDPTENIVCIEADKIYTEKEGIIEEREIAYRQFIMSGTRFTKDFIPLDGQLFYKYIKYYDDEDSYKRDKKLYYGRNTFMVNDIKEATMILNGFTYFKGMKVSDVSVLAFDIETTGLEHNNESSVLLISNTYRSQGQTIKRLFSLDEFTDQKEMLEYWCGWVRARNPSIIVNHNIFGFDIPYLDFVARKAGTELYLGRDGSAIKFNKYDSKFRKDGSQDYNYKRAYIYGREIVDTLFMAIHFDTARKYESYGLKSIIKYEGLEKQGRQFYDASRIAKDWHDPEKRALIKRYGEDDADDALALYNLMAASYFYLAQSVPKSFQTINYTATGSQINAFLIRSYLQEGHSLPQTSEVRKFQGAISMGNVGIFANCWKVDVNSLYPSIILQYEIYDRRKDPKAYFLKMVKYFTEQRLLDKKKAAETGDRYYKELEQSRKVFVNSAYGLLGASGLLFNSVENADLVTSYGREILKKTILWATGHEFVEKEELEKEQDGNETT